MQWTRLRSFAATQSFPHVFVFEKTESDSGKAAVDAYQAALAKRKADAEAKAAAEAEAKAAAVAREQHRLDEIMEALNMLTTDDDEPPPERQQEAICAMGKS